MMRRESAFWRERVFRRERSATHAPLRVNDSQFAFGFESANLGRSWVAQGPHSGPAALPAVRACRAANKIIRIPARASNQTILELSLIRAAQRASRWKSRRAGVRALRYISLARLPMRCCGLTIDSLPLDLKARI